MGPLGGGEIGGRTGRDEMGCDDDVGWVDGLVGREGLRWADWRLRVREGGSNVGLLGKREWAGK
jgi:hypothetical protein